MAVDVKSKRKRKHDASAGEEEVPKKLAKKVMKTVEPNIKQKKPKKQKKEQQQEAPQESVDLPGETEVDVGNADETVGEEDTVAVQEHDSGFDEKELRFSKDFKMVHFRTKLRSNSFITELRHFLHMVQSRPKFIAKYIEKRGKPLELAEALERVDKSNVLHIGYLCEALQLVLLEIVTNQKTHMESAVYASRYFLKSHGAVLELLLKSAQLQHRRIALKLLTAFVCVDPHLGRQLLSSYDVLSNVKTIENFLSHSHLELHETETVRKCFIHFVLAYLVDGNTLLIRNILDRGALLRALVSGLQYDDHVTACVVLNTLRKYVLECAEISKTKKVHVFDVECCKHFVRLYDWQGPKVYASKFSGKNGAQKMLQQHQIEALVEFKEREAVAKSLHEFLLLLLTSRKHGICFDAVTHFRQKHNAVQGKLIGCLYKPWCNERKIELVLHMLEACPDLARHTVRHFAGIVNPIRTPSRDWVAATNFLTRVINTLHPRLLRNALDKITLTDCTYWIKDVCLPIETLALLTGSKMLRHKHFDFRVATNRLLLAMFTQYSNYMSAINKREKSRNNINSLRRFRLDILNHILVNFPTVENILLSLYMSISNQMAPEVDVLSHLDVTLDLLLVICKENRSFINQTSTILDYLEVLRPLYANDDKLVTAQNAGNIKLELKAIKTILLLFPKALQPTAKLFNSVMKSFVKAFVYGSTEVCREAGDLLHKIFVNTGLFDAGIWEVDLWLEALRFFDTETVDVVTQVFIEVLQVTKAEVDAPTSAETVVDEENLHKLFENIEKGLSVQAYVESISISKLMPLIYKGVNITHPLDKYLETVCLLLYHYYPTPELVLQLYELEFTALSEYMRSWLPTSVEGAPLQGDIAKSVPQLIQLHNGLLQGEQRLLSTLFKPTNPAAALELTLHGEQLKIAAELKSERLVMIYVQQTFFLIAQLVQKQRLQRPQAETAALFLSDCIEIVRALQSAEIDVSNESAVEGEQQFLYELLKYIFNLRVTHMQSTELFSAATESHLNYLHFLRLLTEHCNGIEHFDVHVKNCRLKIVKAVAISLQKLEQTKAQSEKLIDAVRLVRAFQLHAPECIEILDLLTTELKYNDYFCAESSGALQKSIYYELLVCALQRVASLRKAVQCDNFVRKFVKLYVNFAKRYGAEINLEQLEESFYDFLLVCHQYIPQLGVKFFGSIFVERRHGKSTIKLACLLLERDNKLLPEFAKLLPDNVNKKELIYPLLTIAFRKQLEMESSLLQNIYQAYKSGFMKTIEKPQKAGVIYKENVDASIALIAQCMPRSECLDFCHKSFKFDATEIYQIRIIHAIYRKAMESLDAEAVQQKAMIYVNFINLLLQLLSVDLKKQQLDIAKLELCAFLLYDWCQRSTTKSTENFDPDYTKILRNQQWLNFCKLCLKLGMHVSEIEVEIQEQQTDTMNGLLLKVLAYLCDQLYSDATETDEETPSVEPVQLFEMICTHSKFFDIVLSPNQTPSQVKTQVLHLLYILAKKNTAALSGEQVPIILGAYQAKLSDADRYALALLQLYELYDCGLQQYRPFIWGESAVAFYSLRAVDEERAKLTQQETSITQVMSLIDRQVCEYTIENFPIWRQLNAGQQLPQLVFDDPAMKALKFGTNSLEQCIERGITEFDVDELRLCPKREGISAQCYDPAFFVPLMNMCFAPESYAHPARPVQNGLLSLVFAALSAQDRDMRLAAACVQQRYRAHFEANKFFERPLWVQAYDNIQAGLSELRDSWMKHKKNSGTPRVPYISGLFVAKTFNLTTDPTHLLYKQLTMYLRLKSTFNFQCVPEFNVLFYSPEIEHQSFRQFIVDVIRNGIKSSSDLFLLVTTNTFKVLQGFYGSSMSTLDMNLLILSVFSTCAKIPASAKIMIETVGLLPWLSAIISTIEFYHFDVIEGLISIVSNLWYAVKANAKDLYNCTHIQLELQRLVLRLLPYMSARITPHNFARLMNVLQKTANGQHKAMSEAQLDNVIACAEKHYGTLVHDIEGIKAFGGAGSCAHDDFCKELHAQQAEPMTILALSSLRAYVIDWWQCQRQRGEMLLNGEATTRDETLIEATA